MNARLRKLVGSLGILAFLLFYVGLAALIGSKIPDQWALKLLYYALVGTLWGVPIIPLITWMNREP